jgi:hypothetical protein
MAKAKSKKSSSITPKSITRAYLEAVTNTTTAAQTLKLAMSQALLKDMKRAEVLERPQCVELEKAFVALDGCLSGLEETLLQAQITAAEFDVPTTTGMTK